MNVGKRHGKSIVLVIDAKKMAEDGQNSSSVEIACDLQTMWA